MKYSRPAYAARFRCLASACPDSCCQGWELPVDDASLKRYQILPGAGGAAVRRAVTTDPEGQTVFRQRAGRCPFLDEGGLCRLRREFGYRLTPAVCRQHPYFRELYEGFREDCPSLSCPAAARLIWETPVRGAYPTPEVTVRDAALRILLDDRARLLDAIREQDPPAVTLAALYAAAVHSQEALAAAFPDEAPDAPGAAPRFSPPAVAVLAGEIPVLLAGTEILTPAWRAALTASQPLPMQADYDNFCLDYRVPLNRALAYGIYRWYLKAVNTLSPLPVSDLIAFLTCFPAYLALRAGNPPQEWLRLCSKETEHSSDNTDFLITHFTNVPADVPVV